MGKELLSLKINKARYSNPFIMKFKLDKKVIIQTLFITAVILLAANLLLAKFSKHEQYHTNLKDIETKSINVKFLGDLRAFALHDNWIKEIKSSKTKADYSYTVDVPKDLPIPVILNEIYGSFDGDNVKLKTDELVTGGKTSLNIFSDNKLKLAAEFNYRDSLNRQGGSVGLLIDGFDRLSNKKIDYLIKFPQTFAALLIPSKASLQLCDSLTEYRKEYVVLLNDDIKDMDYKLSGGFSPARLKSAIRTIIGAYQNALFYAIDDKSKLYNSSEYPLIKNEFEKRGMKLLKISSFKLAEGSNDSETTLNFDRYVKQKGKEGNSFILISAGNFSILQPQIFSMIKIGYKFINPSLILAAKEKEQTSKN